LPFLTSNEVDDFLVSDLMRIKPVNGKIVLFLDYLVDSYINMIALKYIRFLQRIKNHYKTLYKHNILGTQRRIY